MRPMQTTRAVDIGVHHRPARIRLERQRLHHPALAETVEQRAIVAIARVREAVEQPVHAFEHRARTREAGARQQRRPQAGLRGPARMHALGPAAVGQVLDDAARHRAGDAHRIDQLAPPRVAVPRRRPRQRRSRRTPPSDESPPCAPPSAPPGSGGRSPPRLPRCRAAPLCPDNPSCSAAASTAGTTTAPACTGPPSKVSSKSSPCAAVPLMKAAPAALRVSAKPITVAGPASGHAECAAVT